MKKRLLKWHHIREKIGCIGERCIENISQNQSSKETGGQNYEKKFIKKNNCMWNHCNPYSGNAWRLCEVQAAATLGRAAVPKVVAIAGTRLKSVTGIPEYTP